MSHPGAFLKIRHAICFATGLIASVQAAEPASAPPSIASSAPKAAAISSLKGVFKDAFYFGVALNASQFTGQNPQGAALVLQEFDSISPENCLKWESVEPENGEFRFEQSDQYVDFGVKHKLFTIGHTLVWHSQLPLWVSEPEPGAETLTKEVLIERLRRHVMTVAGHYKGKVTGWDVLNEAVDDKGGYRDTVFLRVIGKEYIPMVFKWTREADPHAELYYNDYNLDESDAKRATTIELLKYLQAEGAPIDGVGMQGHYNLNSPAAAKIDETIRMFSELGLKVMITELDVQVNRDAKAVITGAVGAPTEAAPAQPPPKPPTAAEWEARMRALAITPDKPLPTIDAFKTSLVLTEEQQAKITPILEADARQQATINGDKIKQAKVRSTSIKAIRALLSGEQHTLFTRFLNSRAGGARVGPPPTPLTDAEQQALAKRYGEIFAVFMKHQQAITRVTFWGLRDADSWRRHSSPLIFDDNYERKPAYNAVIHSAALTE